MIQACRSSKLYQLVCVQHVFVFQTKAVKKIIGDKEVHTVHKAIAQRAYNKFIQALVGSEMDKVDKPVFLECE